MLKKYFFNFKTLFILALLISLGSCKSIEIPVFSTQNPPAEPNYNDASTWAVLPNTYPENLKKWQTNTANLPADVFYIYPTLNLDKKDLRWNVPISDKVQQNKVLNTAVYFQASAFLNAGKLYVPYYRQAHLRAYSQYQNGGKEALNLAYADVKAAFQYYLKNYNNNRPFIIASHSQGTTHAIRLLKELVDGKPIQKQLIAAYIPGIAVKKDAFKSILFMTSPTQTGGFVAWNTYKKNYYPKTFSKWFEGSAVSNPITWDDSKTSLRAAHKGFLFGNGKMYTQALQVYVKNGILWTSLPHFPYRLFAIGKKRYHAGDINLFWEDIRLNAEMRVKSYFKAD